MNITLDDTSPQFQYMSTNVSSGWVTDHTFDPQAGNYFGKTFYATYGEGDSVSLTFNGSAIAIYGAKRDNHGVYSAQVDGGTISYMAGYSKDAQFQAVLFSTEGLSNDREHTVILTNLPSQTSPPAGNVTVQWWLDIDYAVITTATSGKIYTTTYDDTYPGVQYLGGGWDIGPPLSPQLYYNQTAHINQRIGDSFQLKFNGSSVQLFGGLYPDHGNYSVSIDGASSDVYNGTFFQLATVVSMYQASNLQDGPHTLLVTNLGQGPNGSFIDFDYVVVNSTIDPTASSVNGTGDLTSTTSTALPTHVAASRNNAGAIAGGVVGGIIGIVLVAVLALFLLRRSNKRKQDGSDYPARMNGRMDLNGEEIKPYEHGAPQDTGAADAGEYVPLAISTASGRSHGFTTGDSHSSPASEAGLTGAPFLTRIPPPPPSNATSYPRSINPPSSAGRSSPPSFLPERGIGSGIYPNPFTGGTDASGERSPHFADQQGPPALSSIGGNDARNFSSAPAYGKSAGVALPYTARQPDSPPQARHQVPTDQIPDIRHISGTSIQRMFVPGREQDMGPLPLPLHEDEEGDDLDKSLPPDYHQATEPLPGQLQRRE